MRLGSLSSPDTLSSSPPHSTEEWLPEAKTHASEPLLRLVGGFWASCALYVAAKLEIADFLREEPLRSETLAALTGAHAPSLSRVLRALASVGIFSEDEQGYFTLTPDANLLRSDRPDSLRAFVLAELGGAQYRAWEDVLYSVKTGRPARREGWTGSLQAEGTPGCEDRHAADEMFEGLSARVRAAILRGYNFSKVGTVVDIGGGDGTFLAFLLQAYEPLRGVVFDFPRAVEAAQLRLAAEGVAKRGVIMAGDYLDVVPSGRDLYTLRWVVRRYSDAHAATILKNCRRAMSARSKLLIVEAVAPTGNAPSFAKLQDINLLVSSEGRERTEAEFRSLLRQAGLRLNRILPTSAEVCILEAGWA